LEYSRFAYLNFNFFETSDINIEHIFSSSDELKCLIASLIHACARLDRD